MMMYQVVIVAMLIIVYLIFKILKQPHPFLKSIASLTFSLGILLILNILSEKIGIIMPLNLANIFTAGILGIPGVCLMIILNAIL